MKHLLLYNFILFPFLLSAQDWSLFPYNQQTYYGYTYYDDINRIQIAVADSILIDGAKQTSYFTYNDPTRNWNGCDSAMLMYFDFQSLYSELLPGVDSLVYENGATRIFSQDIDFEMDFWNNANYLDTFHMLSAENSDIYTKCFYVGVTDVFGVTDSVKKFRFYREVGTTNLTDFTIELTKYHGLKTFIDFNFLADFVEGSDPVFHEMDGFKNNTEHGGYRIPEWQEYFPYGEGDIRVWDQWIYDPNPMYFSDYHIYHKDSITQILMFADSIIYTYNRINKDIDGILTYSFDLSETYTKSGFETLLEGYPDWLIAANNTIESGYDEGLTIWWPEVLTYFIEGTDTIFIRSGSCGEYYLDTSLCELQAVYDVGIWFSADTRSGIFNKNIGVGDGDNSWSLAGYTINGLPYGNIDFETIGIEANHSSSVSIFPNPATNRITINVSQNIELNYSIHTIDGSLISTGRLINGNINVEALPTGIYLIQLQNLNEVFYGRFAKL